MSMLNRFMLQGSAILSQHSTSLSPNVLRACGRCFKTIRHCSSSGGVPPLGSRLKLLIGPASFTALVGTSIHFYSRSHPCDKRKEYQKLVMEKFTHTQLLTYGIVASNLGILLLWRSGVAARFLSKYMLSDIYGAAPVRSMIGSMFSHYNYLHLAMNMYVLHSLSTITLDPNTFIQIYLTGGLAACLGAFIKDVFRPQMAAKSLGASGAILAMIGYTVYQRPDARFSLAFVDMIVPHSFSAQQAFYGIVAFESCGLLFGWKIFNHACHLTGLLSGYGLAQTT